MTDLKLFLRNLTTAPGVYRMIDANGTVLYVGKAANLKKRVTSYFKKMNNEIKTRSLVSQIVDVEVSVTRSETEALLLESSLIKSLRPKYNVLLRDDKSYPYIHVSSNHPFPRMELYRSKKKPQKGEFYGPYPSVAAVRETLTTIQKVFKIRNCSDNYFSARSRPCLQYQIKRCTAPCTRYISEEDYQLSVKDARKFLQGKSQQILDEMTKRMEIASASLAFEEAAMLRDQIKSLRLIQEQQAVAKLSGDADIIVVDAKPSLACILCVTIREGQVLASQSFFPSIPKLSFADDEKSLWQEIFQAFIAFHYIDTPARIPALIITQENLTEQTSLETMLSELRGKICKIQTKPRGLKARWLDFALNNLKEAIAKQSASAASLAARYKELASLLELEKPISRMECFDISHTQGESTVASCVVFGPEGPKRNEYRRFNINNIKPGDDYAAMEQVLSRRFKRLLKEENLPDLLIIDGGKGQVSVAKRVLAELGIEEGLTIVGIAKGPSRKAGFERLILVAKNLEITLPEDSLALHLLQHIRDEAHRFAITSHRKKRQHAGLDSTLETIGGVGPKKRKALLLRFGGLRELAKAPVEELLKVHGISKELAQRIFQFFHP